MSVTDREWAQERPSSANVAAQYDWFNPQREEAGETWPVFAERVIHREQTLAHELATKTPEEFRADLSTELRELDEALAEFPPDHEPTPAEVTEVVAALGALQAKAVELYEPTE